MKLKFSRSMAPKLAGLLFLQLILIFLNFDFQIYMGGDAHSDILLAESILSGNGFRDIWDPQQPQDNWRRPGMPLLIAFLYLLFGHHYLIFKLLIVLLTLGATALLYLIFKDEMDSDLWFLLLLFVTNAAILEFAHYELSEIPYLLVVLLSLYFWKKQRPVGTVLCLILAYHIRTEALALMAAFLIYYLFLKNWKKFLISGASILAGILPWTLRSVMLGGNQQIKVLLAKNEYYLDAGMIGFADLAQRIFHNFKLYFSEYGGVVMLNTDGFLSILMMPLALLGLWSFSKISRTGTIIFLFVLLHLLIMLLWQPSATHFRYLITISPFLILGMVYGFRGTIKFLKGTVLRIILWLVIILNFTLLVPRFKANLPILTRNLAGELRASNSRDTNELLNAFEWLKRQREQGILPEDQVVVCRQPQFCYYYSGLRSVNFPFTENQEVVFNFLISRDLVVVENTEPLCILYLNKVVFDSTKYFKLLYRTRGDPPYLGIFAVKKDEVAKLLHARP